MSENIPISIKEYISILEFNSGINDHAYIFPKDESNVTLICHGNEDGTIKYNGKKRKLSEIVKDVKSELKVKSKYFYLDVACCFASNIAPYIDSGCTIRPRYLNKDVLNYSCNSEQIQFSYIQ